MNDDFDIDEAKHNQGFPYSLLMGLDLQATPNNLKQACREAKDLGFDFLAVTLFHSANFRDQTTIQTRQIAQTRSDSCMNSRYWNGFILAKLSGACFGADSPFWHVRERAEATTR